MVWKESPIFEYEQTKLRGIKIKKKTNEKNSYLDNITQDWSLGFVPVVVNGHVDVPTKMKLPSNGMWALNIYIKEKFHG